MNRRFLSIVAVATLAIGFIAAPAFAQMQTGTLDRGEEMLPPNAKPGECYARIFVPPVFKTESETLVKREAGQRVEIVPARYEWAEERVLVKPESKMIEAVPAQYETVTERVIDTPARVEWKKGEGPYQRIDNATGEIMCLVEVPATYKTITKRVLKSPATTREVTVPAKYTTVRVQKEVSPPTTRTIEIPAEYQTVSKKVKVSSGGMEWTQVLCKTNATPDTIQALQRSLKSKGFYTGPIDGIVGQGTLAAVRSYQQRNGLVQGGLTIETLKSLGVR